MRVKLFISTLLVLGACAETQRGCGLPGHAVFDTDTYAGQSVGSILSSASDLGFLVTWNWDFDAPGSIREAFPTEGRLAISDPRRLRVMAVPQEACEAGLYYRADLKLELGEFSWSTTADLLHREQAPTTPVVPLARGDIDHATSVEAVIASSQEERLNIEEFRIIRRFGQMTLDSTGDDSVLGNQELEYVFENELYDNGEKVAYGWHFGAQGRVDFEL